MSRYSLKWSVGCLLAILLTTFAAVPVLAFDARSGDNVTVASGEVVDDDLYIAGSTIIIDGTVNGDVTRAVRIAGGTLEIKGTIGGDVVAAGGEMHITSTAKVGNDLILGTGQASIVAPVDGDIIGGAGDLTLSNVVGGNVTLDVDSLTLLPTANIQGNLAYTSENEADIQPGAQIEGTTAHKVPEVKVPAEAGPLSGIRGKVVAFLMTLLAGIVIILVAPRRAAAVAASIRREPGWSVLWGSVILFGVLFASIVVCFTVIGIPLALITLALWGIGIYLSQIAVGLFIGYWIIGYFGKVETRGVLIGALALGFFLLTLLKLIPYVGFLLWLATVLFGLGAMTLSQKTLQDEATQRVS
jgi:cytoskeletal protein CcmA (bactofilin family)